MPNRIIKESVRYSYEIEDLSPSAEVTFYRLLTFADDYGRFPSDIRILQSQLFPLKSSVRSKDFNTWISELIKTGLIRLYVGEDDKPYGYFVTWENHQTVRNQRSKYPEPQGDGFDDLNDQLSHIESIRNQLKSIEINCARESNPIQSESESESISAQRSCYEFDDFWEDYDKKKDRTKCEKKWKKISESDRELIQEFIPIYKKHQPDNQFRKNPLTFLNQKTWLDDWQAYPPIEKQKKINNGHSKTKGDQAVEYLSRA